MGHFTNWSGYGHANPRRFTRPRTAEELAALVAETSDRGGRIRMIGAGHSFTPVALGDDVMINLDRITGLIHVDRQRMTARFHAGTRLRDIPGLLGPHGLALANQGDVNPQALAGAVSTGTHGTGLGFTGFAGMTRGLTLIAADGTTRELSAEHEPDVFDLARLSVGVLGAITEVELDLVDAFDLVAQETAEDVDELLESFIERARAADHMEFYFFPNTDRALVKTNTRVAPGTTAPGALAAIGGRNRLAQLLSEELVDNGALRAMCEIGMQVPTAVPGFNRLAAAATSNRSYRGAAHEIFVSPRRVKFNEMEYAVPLEEGPAVVREVRDLIERTGWRISFPIEVRVAKGDDVPLSTAYGRDSMYIAVHRFFKEDFTEYFRRVEQIARAHGGRPHWGKLHNLTTDDLRASYPRFDDFCALRERLDPGALFGNGFTDSLFGIRSSRNESKTTDRSRE